MADPFDGPAAAEPVATPAAKKEEKPKDGAKVQLDKKKTKKHKKHRKHKKHHRRHHDEDSDIPDMIQISQIRDVEDSEIYGAY